MAVTNGMLDPGNVIVSAPYYIAGKTGALTVPAAGSPIATLQNLGRIDLLSGPGAAIIPVPLRISAVRMQCWLVSGATRSVAFEIFKGAVTVQHNAGGVTRVPTNRKTTGYPQIAATEVNLFVATTGAISGGTFVADGDSLDVLAVPASAATFGAGASLWEPTDMCPVSLEAGQGMEVRVADQGGAAVVGFHVCFDFLRQ